MLGFSSDAPVLMRPDVAGEAAEGVGQVQRVFVPIRDPEAHATFYLCLREDQVDGGGLVASVVELVGRL
jgi:hypothetical protein